MYNLGANLRPLFRGMGTDYASDVYENVIFKIQNHVFP